jgi:hypothetical protein
METEINIVEILKDKPQGTKLYSSACGKCKLEEVDDKSFKISFYNSKFGFMNGGEGHLDKNGKLYDDGECVVFPSKEMRDWRKFDWKKGDVLVNKDGDVYIIFERFVDDTYCSFLGKYYLWKENNDTEQFYEKERLLTSDFQKAGKDAAQTYINTIEERLGGKLNRESLEVEKTQPKFKDGDIVALVVRKCTHIAIFQSRQGAYIGFHAVLCQNDELLLEEPFREDVGDIELRLATDSEKQQLFEALAKESKQWDAGKKMIIDLKQKVELKPFDNVLVRHQKTEEWRANIFSHTDKTDEYLDYVCVNGRWEFCIPYEGNESLLGTTKDVEDRYD